MEKTIIDNEEYKLKIRRTWVATTEVWHLEFISESVFDTRWECFLSEAELQKFKDAL